MKIRIILLALTIALMSTIPNFAENIITLETLKQRSTDSSADLMAIDAGIMTLQENYNKVMDASEKLHELYDLYLKYKMMYENGAHQIPNPMVTPGLPPQQIETYYAYWTLQQIFFDLYGIVTPSLSEDEIYRNFIFTADILPLQLIGQINTLRIDRQRAEAAIKNGVEVLWWNLGLISQQLNLLNEYEQLLQQQFEIYLKRLELGQLSELELNKKRIEIEIAKNNRKKVEREIENLKYRMRSLAGVAFNEDFEVNIQVPNISELSLLEYEAYIRVAMRTRTDAIRALQVLDSATQEERIIRSFVSNSESGIRREARLKRIEAEQRYQKFIQNLDYEIFSQYVATVNAKEQYEAMRLKQHLALLDHNRIKALFNQGYISVIDFEAAKLALTQAGINFESAQYQYVLQVQQLNHIIHFGSNPGGAF